MFIILLVITVLIASSKIGKRVSDTIKAYADPNLIENALLKAQENKEVVEFLGTLKPIDNMAILEGIVTYSNKNRTIDIYVRIKGSKGKGRMRVFADWNGDKWEYNTIAIASKKLKKSIVIISKKE